MLVRIANRKELEKQSDLSLRCSSRPVWLATSVQNFKKTFNEFAVFSTFLVAL